MEQHVFDKIADAASRGTSVELTFADVTLLQELMGGELAKAGGEYDRWRDIFAEYDRNAQQKKTPT